MLLVRTLSQSGQSVLCILTSATLLVLAIWLVSLQADAVLLLNDHDDRRLTKSERALLVGHLRRGCHLNSCARRLRTAKARTVLTMAVSNSFRRLSHDLDTLPNRFDVGEMSELKCEP